MAYKKKEKVNPYLDKIRFRIEGQDRVFNPNTDTKEELMPIADLCRRLQLKSINTQLSELGSPYCDHTVSAWKGVAI